MWTSSIQTLPSFTMRLPSNDTGPVTRRTFIFSIRSRSWSYRGEGNANLVLSIPSERTIVRLRKCPRYESSQEAEERIWREVKFCRHIMRPLLGELFVHVPEVVKINKSDILYLNEILHPLRPSYRHHKSEYGHLAAVFPDLCFLRLKVISSAPTFCVEVKPKQGWIPLPDRRLSKCTFCLNQFLKLREGNISQRSSYCPLDLFSGDFARMKSAILALVKSPQNNFKMFRNGCLMFSDNMPGYLQVLEEWFGPDQTNDRLLDNLCTLVVRALLADFGKFEFPAEVDAGGFNQQPAEVPRIPQALINKARNLIREPTCFKPAEPLPPGCILSRILRIQQLDEAGSDEMYREFATTDKTDYEYVSAILDDRRKLYQPLHSYLIATTAKDCSILIAFKQCSNLDSGGNSVCDLNGEKYVFNIGVSDLDPKPMSCLKKHKKRDLEAVQSCIDLLEENVEN